MFLPNRDILDVESFITKRPFIVNRHFAVSPKISDTLLLRIDRWHSMRGIGLTSYTRYRVNETIDLHVFLVLAELGSYLTLVRYLTSTAVLAATHNSLEQLLVFQTPRGNSGQCYLGL